MTVRVVYYHVYSLICNVMNDNRIFWPHLSHLSGDLCSMEAAILFAMHLGKFNFIFTSATRKSTKNAEWLASAFIEISLTTVTRKNDRECIRYVNNGGTCIAQNCRENRISHVCLGDNLVKTAKMKKTLPVTYLFAQRFAPNAPYMLFLRS